MAHNLTPQYLPSLILSTATETSIYNLQNSNDIRTLHARSKQHVSPFLHSILREWNTLTEKQETPRLSLL